MELQIAALHSGFEAIATSVSGVVCDVGKGEVGLSGSSLSSCNGSSVPSFGDFLTVIGNSSENGISLNQTNVTVLLSDVSVTVAAPFTILESSVVLIAEGSNEFRSFSGSGQYAAVECSASNVTITSARGGAIAVDGGEAPGFGASVGGVCASLSFVNSTIDASSSYGSGIGTGYCSPGDSHVNKLTISNSTINASSSFAGSGIGTGYCDSANSSVNELTIVDSIINTSSSDGSGIGTGVSLFCGSSHVNELTIANSTINASSSDGSGLGTGPRSVGGASTIEMLRVLNSTVWSNGSMTINSSSVLISGGSLTFITNDAPLFSNSPRNVGSFDLVIGYRRETSDGSEHLSSLEGPFLHVGSLSIPDPNSNSLKFCIRRVGFERCFDDRTGRIKSVIVRDPGAGPYSFRAWLDGIGGDFASSDGQTAFPVESNYSFLDNLTFRIRWMQPPG
jgi:hypothetical protein